MSREEIIEEILTNAANLFRKWGFNKTTIEDIAKASGKTKSFLYYYYKDKEEIFIEVITREMNEISSLVSREVEKYSQAEDQLKIYVHTYLCEFEKYGNLYNIICGEIGGDLPLLNRLAKKIDSMQAGIIRRILEHGIKNGEFRVPEGIDVTAIAYVILNTIGSIQLDTFVFNNRNEYNVESIIGWLFTNGLNKRLAE